MSLSEKNHSEHTLDELIDQYYKLKQQRNLLDKRINGLRNFIIRCAPHNDFQSSGYRVQTQMRTRVTYDPAELEQLIYDKGLEAECLRPQVDESLVEQAFIEGKITDTDLRAIRKTTVNLALTVDEVRNVQTDDDSNRGQ